MTIATSKTKPNSKRHFLIRMEPARHLSDLLAAQGGGIYTYTMPAPVSKVTRNGTELTQVAASPTSNDEWYYDESSGQLEVKLASAPNDSTNVVVGFYYLFYTDGVAQNTFETPTDSGTTVRLWEPRIKNSPAISETIKNVFTGTVTLGATPVKLLNPDNEFNQYLTSEDSFNNKSVRMWMVVDDTIELLFDGFTTKVKATSSLVTLTTVDKLVALKQPALMGDTRGEAFYLAESGSFPNMDTTKTETPVPFVFTESRGKVDTTTKVNEGISRTSSSNIRNAQIIDGNTAITAVCTDTTGANPRAQNRKWGLGRIPSNTFKSLTFGTVTQVLVTGAGANTGFFYNDGAPANLRGNGNTDNSPFRARVIITCSAHNFEVGDNFKLDNIPVRRLGGSFTTTGYCRVTEVSTSEIRAIATNIQQLDSVLVPGQSTTLSSSNLTALDGPVVYISQGGGLWMPVVEQDFTYTTTATSGGNYFLEITFNDAFEITLAFSGDANVSIHNGLQDLVPQDQVYSVIRLNTATTHAKAVERLITDAGLDIDTASITQADTDLSANAVFTIPYFDESQPSPYLKYLQNLLVSTFGYVGLNTSLEIYYKLFAVPSSTDERDENLILQDSIRTTLSYQDLVTQIIAFNPHSSSDLASVTYENNKAKYLHGVDNTTRFRHYIDNISPVLTRLGPVKASRFLKYAFQVATEDLDTSLGDDITMVTSYLLGEASSKQVKVISTTKSSDTVTVEATDLEGL